MTKINENGQLYFTFEEVSNHPIVQKMINKFFVSDLHKEIAVKAFYRVWIRHYNAWDSSERKEQHSLDNISKIVWDKNEKCFKVYYKKTKNFSAEWYHYTLKGDWY
jgi:hypothetical protein